MLTGSFRGSLRRAAGAAVLLAALPAGAQDSPAEPTGGRPVSRYPTYVHDFGEVARGDKLAHAFKVHNDGDAPLEIKSVHPT